jgi:ribonuclease P/MRP protein subunit POP5
MKNRQKTKPRRELKLVMPTLREKERYIAFQIISEDRINYEDFESSIWGTMMSFFGEYGSSKSSMWLIKNLYDEEKQIGVIRCNHESVAEVLTMLGLIERLGDTRIIVKILKVSGTIKGLK